MDYVICQICGDVLEQLTDSHLRQHNITLNEYKNLYPGDPAVTDKMKQRLVDISAERVRCRICGQFLKEISFHHLKKHSISLAEYKQQFPDAEIFSQATVARREQSAREHSQRMQGANNPFYGKKHSDETLLALSNMSKTLWEEDREVLTEKLREAGKRMRGENNPRWKGGYEAGVGGGHPKFKARRRALRVHGNKCMIPGCEFDFIVHNHHIIPRSEGGSHSLENCILLCPNHHALADAGILTREYLHDIVDLSLKGDQISD